MLQHSAKPKLLPYQGSQTKLFPGNWQHATEIHRVAALNTYDALSFSSVQGFTNTSCGINLQFHNVRHTVGLPVNNC
jgi:hypothetical protein